MSPDHEQFLTGLRSTARVTKAEAAAVETLPLRSVEIDAGEEIVHLGSAPTRSCLLVEGILARQQFNAQGRQILSLHVAGDIPDLHSMHLDAVDYALVALTPCHVSFISHQSIREVLRREPTLGGVFWRYTLIEAAIARAWLGSFGRKSALERVAHLYCEMFVRMRARGIADVDSFSMPIMQLDVADAMALTPQHVSRTVNQLRKSGALVQRGKADGVKDWKLLQQVAHFDATYLNLRGDFS